MVSPDGSIVAASRWCVLFVLWLCGSMFINVSMNNWTACVLVALWLLLLMVLCLHVLYKCNVTLACLTHSATYSLWKK